MIGPPGWVDTDRATERGLTPNHVQVLTGVARGFTYRQIAGQLRVSSHTVHTRVGALLRVMGARSQAEAVALCYDAGILRTAVEREWRARMGLAA